MDDTKTIDESSYPVTIAGTEYLFSRPEPELIERMILISHMNADSFVTLEACTKWLSVAAGPENWSAIMRRFMAGEVGAQDLLDGMGELLTKWTATKEKEPAADAA